MLSVQHHSVHPGHEEGSDGCEEEWGRGNFIESIKGNNKQDLVTLEFG